jgi:phenylpropionate dioxygenase-like ring-hydroxylating dioxygenase large terminal subunit
VTPANHEEGAAVAEVAPGSLAADFANDLVPSHLYTDPALFEQERERVFQRSWQFLAHESEVAQPGDFVVRYLGDDSILVCRGSDGVVRAFFNVCRHRGMQVCRAELGNVRRFTCPYHGWLYDTSGELISVPLDRPFFGPTGIDRAAHALRRIPRLETFEGFVFGALVDDVPPLEEYLGDYAWYLKIHTGRDPQGMEVIGEPQRWQMAANWKTGAENFMGDSYHAQYTHRSVFEIGLHPNTTGDWQAKGKRNGIHVNAGPATLSFARQAPGERGYPDELVRMFRDTLPAAQRDLVFDTPCWPTRTHVFPNFSMLNAGAYVAEGQVAPFLNIRVWRPLGPQRVEVWSWVLVEKSAPEWFKRASERAYVLTFGPTGTEEQDDVENFTGIVRALSGSGSRRLRQVVSMGKDLGPEHTHVDWPGPGQAIGTTYTDAGIKRFFELWHAAVGEDGARP